MATTPDPDTLSYPARVRLAVETGRNARTDPAAAETLRAWQAGGFSHRLLAVFACHGSRDTATLVTLIADPSRAVARTALGVLGHVGDDDTLVNTLDALPPRLAAKILLRLWKDRPAAADRFVSRRADAGDDAAWPLVPLGSSATLDRHFATAAERGGDLFWKRLATFHPSRAATEIVARLDAATTPDGLLFNNARAVVDRLSDTAPDAALTALAALHRHVKLVSIPYGDLLRRRPVAVAELVLAATDPPGVTFERVAHRLGVEKIVALFRKAPYLLGDPDHWLARLPAADRAAVFRELGPAWTPADGVISIAILRRMPADVRVAEARRVIARPKLAARPLQRLQYAGLLPWAEAREHTAAWLGHPEADHRTAALVALCEATRFDRTRLGELLTLLAARKFEQDPVRYAFLTAVAGLPPGRWQAEHLPGIARVVRDSLDAADLSSGSVTVVGRLLFGLLLFHPEWASEQLAEVTRERGFPHGGPSRVLTPEDVRRIAPVLTPVIEKWRDREHEGALIALAGCVGDRLPLWPAMSAVLERVVHGSAAQYTAAAALALLIRHLPADRERLVTTALGKDESWVMQFPVLNYLHKKRQDLLTPFLGQRAYSGRFSTGNVRHVLGLDAGFHRWTDGQQETFAATLAEAARPPSRKKDVEVTWDVLHAVRRLPALPAVGPERLIRLAGDKRPAVQEAAVRALGRLDARQGIPELLEALGDARARWAVYALRSALADLPPTRVLTVMRGVPLGKVTVAKEAVRLAGEFGGPAALGWFTELDGQRLHRDVRGALLRALWDHLERPEAWAILDPSAASPDPGVVIGLARIQVGRASAAARQKVADLFVRLLAHPEPTVRVAVLERLATQPVPDPRRELLAVALAKLESQVPDEQAAGVRAALAGATDADAPAFAAAFTRLLPARRELAASAEMFADQTRDLGPRLIEVRSAVLAALEADPMTASLQVRLAAARLAAGPFARWVTKLAATDRWHAGTQAAVEAALAGREPSAAEMERAETVWMKSADAGTRRLALRTLVLAAAAQGWTPARLERLAGYRRDPSPAVADEAAFTFPPEQAEASAAEQV